MLVSTSWDLLNEELPFIKKEMYSKGDIKMSQMANLEMDPSFPSAKKCSIFFSVVRYLVRTATDYRQGCQVLQKNSKFGLKQFLEDANP